MIDNENANSIKTFKVICGDILTEKNNTNKIIRWVDILGIEKKITEYHRWWGWKKQKIYIEISGDILKKKNNTNKRLRWGHILGIKRRAL